ncbi:MAG: Dna2/Cas4 domain-containing protein [Bacteroidia bacterium]
MIRRGDISSENKKSFENGLKAIINHSEVTGWYSGTWQVKNEADIISSDGTLLRPDRVMIRGKKAIVVDYKSGKQNPKYHQQVKDYKKVLGELGYEEIQGFLYYMKTGLVEEVI